MVAVRWANGNDYALVERARQSEGVAQEEVWEHVATGRWRFAVMETERGAVVVHVEQQGGGLYIGTLYSDTKRAPILTALRAGIAWLRQQYPDAAFLSASVQLTNPKIGQILNLHRRLGLIPHCVLSCQAWR
jgi:hypothetical protein